MSNDKTRLAEIAAEMHKPRAASLYWKRDTTGEAMRAEYLTLLQRQATAEAPGGPLPGDSELKASIERAMTADLKGYFRAGLDVEYRGVLEREASGSA